MMFISHYLGNKYYPPKNEMKKLEAILSYQWFSAVSFTDFEKIIL
jgi:hypothetical protein